MNIRQTYLIEVAGITDSSREWSAAAISEHIAHPMQGWSEDTELSADWSVSARMVGNDSRAVVLSTSDIATIVHELSCVAEVAREEDAFDDDGDLQDAASNMERLIALLSEVSA